MIVFGYVSGHFFRNWDQDSIIMWQSSNPLPACNWLQNLSLSLPLSLSLSYTLRPKLSDECAQIVLNRSQPRLPRSSSSSSPVFERTPNAGPESSGVVLSLLTNVGTAQMTKGQAPLTDNIWQERLSRTWPTTSLETKSVQWIWRMRLIHQLFSASIFFSRVAVTLSQNHREILGECTYCRAGAWFPVWYQIPRCSSPVQTWTHG